MGCSTRAHFAPIRERGPSPVHRRSFAPVRAAARGAADPQLLLDRSWPPTDVDDGVRAPSDAPRPTAHDRV